LNSKVALKYRGVEVEAMKAIAVAHQNRSLQEFEQALATYREGKLLFSPGASQQARSRCRLK